MSASMRVVALGGTPGCHETRPRNRSRSSSSWPYRSSPGPARSGRSAMAAVVEMRCIVLCNPTPSLWFSLVALGAQMDSRRSSARLMRTFGANQRKLENPYDCRSGLLSPHDAPPGGRLLRALLLIGLVLRRRRRSARCTILILRPKRNDTASLQ